MAESFIVECPVCRQAWEVLEKVEHVPRRQWIRLPAHDQLDDHGAVRDGSACPGGTRANLAGLPGGTRRNWEMERHQDFRHHPVPELLEGADVQVVPLPRRPVE